MSIIERYKLADSLIELASINYYSPEDNKIFVFIVGRLIDWLKSFDDEIKHVYTFNNQMPKQKELSKKDYSDDSQLCPLCRTGRIYGNQTNCSRCRNELSGTDEQPWY